MTAPTPPTPAMTLHAAHPRHAELMRVALRRALRAAGRTAPNPCVGAVLARDGRIISVGHHARAGTAHAEVVALRAAGEQARGADLYVTLEPCSHHGRTPPCVDAILAAGVARVFVGAGDPNPAVNGAGLARLRAAGVTVVEHVEADAAARVVAPFVRWVTGQGPEVILKAAVSLDGRLATHTGASAGLSGPRARAWLHRLRDRVDAILVGRGTVLADDPQLTPRRPPLGRKGPHRLLRVVLDSRLETPLSARVLAGVEAHPTLLVCGPDAPAEREQRLRNAGADVERVALRGSGLDLAEVAARLGRRGVHRVLVEGGGGIHGALLDQRVATHAMLVVVPVFLGDRGVPLARWSGAGDSPADAPCVDPVEVRRLGPDTLVHGPLRYPTRADASAYPAR